MRRLSVVAILGLFVVFVWIGSMSPAASRSAPATGLLQPTPTGGTPFPTLPCEPCAQATLAAALTQAQSDASHLQAQETAANANILLAHNLATFSAATATRVAALTQDALQQAQAQLNLQLKVDSATHSAAATATQQMKDEVVAGAIATQTQAAVAITQGYADQARQIEAQTQEQSAFLQMWGAPILMVAIAALCLLGFWRWTAQPRSGGQLEVSAAISHLQPPDRLPPLAGQAVTHLTPLPKPGGQVRGWMEEVKHKLLVGGKDDDGNSAV